MLFSEHTMAWCKSHGFGTVAHKDMNDALTEQISYARKKTLKLKLPNVKKSKWVHYIFSYISIDFVPACSTETLLYKFCKYWLIFKSNPW